MIYDCFMFFNELELLEIRFNELNHVADRFVVVEATRTHSNKPKPLYFRENMHLFKDFTHKIIHIVVDEYPDYKDSWTYENYQRNQISRALEGCNPEDTIIISDADEIPRPETVLKARGIPGIKVLEQKLFYYYLNMVNVKDTYWLGGSRILRAGDFKKTASEIRYTDGTIMPEGGWHFSYLGGLERILSKIEAFAHQEYNKSAYKDALRLKRAIEKGKDLYGRRKLKFKPVPVDNSFPIYIRNNREKFSDMIRDPVTPSGWNRFMEFISGFTGRKG